MRGLVLTAVLALAIGANEARAQSTTGTISGRVVDSQNLALPGVTVTATSPNLQGERDAVTTTTGDYVISLLPPGTYVVTFQLQGFQSVRKTVNLAPTQVATTDAALGPAALTETVEVVARTADVLTRTAQVATDFSQDLIARLPTTRSLDAALLLAPSVHPTGPSGNYSIAGSMSFESLFLINGVTVNENLRGQANTLYIEDAIQETTIATAGVSAEYGRFGGGVVNVVTKSGGNLFTGSYRDTLNNDNWRALVERRPGDTFANDTKLDRVVPTHEYTFGGPIVRDRLWFFTAGRLQTQQSARQLVQTNIPYNFTQKSHRFEGNATYSPTGGQRVQGTYIRENLEQTNNTFNTALSMDERSLENRRTPQDLFTLNYNGVWSSRFFVESRFSQRNFTFIGSGSKSKDLIDGTLLTDRQRGGLRYWAATFCGVCEPEQRDNVDFFVKGNYFWSSPGFGSHSIVTGYDGFDDRRTANNHQSGSDWRILGTTSIVSGTTITPVFLGDGTTIMQWNPIPVLSKGSHFRTHSVFANDAWRVSDRLTANLGVRYDKNQGANQEGVTVVTDDAFSPRLGVVWDVAGDGKWSATGSVARYVAAVNNSIADSSSKAGNAQTWQFAYRGPNINGGGVAVTPTADAIRQAFAWYESVSGCNPTVSTCRPTLAPNGNPDLPGVSTRIGSDLTSPSSWEYATGISRNFGAGAALRADYIFRDYRDFYVQRTDLTTGRVTELGQTFDVNVIENSNIYKRRYHGLTTQGTYRFTSGTDVGFTYTVSRAWGNLDGENVGSGPVTGDGRGGDDGALAYPEYKRASWNYPMGDIAIDQRHRARLWLNYAVPKTGGLIVSVLQALESGLPYGAAGNVDPNPYLANPGYVNPPAGSDVTYWFTRRDAFRTEGQKRTDLAINYDYRWNVAGRRVGLFWQGQVVNLFNQSQLCGCGASVFLNGGNAQLRFIDQSVRHNVNNRTYAAFNPFTDTPVQGLNWDFGPAFGKALNRFAYTTPRMFRMTFGVRF